MVRKFYFVTALVFSITCTAFGQQGVHGPRTVTAANTIVNEYSNITADVLAGATSITVANSGLNANGRFAGNLQPGELIMLYQVQGCFVENQFTVGAADTVWGKVTNYYQAGRYEFRQVLSVPNATTINIDCGTSNNYNALNGHRCMVVRVPRYTTLTINSGGVLTCDDWNGLIGGVLAVEVQGNTVVNAGGSIDATGKGFRGGSLVGDNASTYGVNNTFSTNNSFGAEKGESILGYQADYDNPWGGRYCRGAAANGGGGGDAHNGGGGGGANAPNSTSPTAFWSGNGIPDPNAAYTAAWNLEPPINTMTLRNATNSAGGGRGGYTFSGNNQNAGITPPGNAAWGGDTRNHQATGLGGRPLDYSTGRIFFGGGGGAGDQNENCGGAGGDGGGLIYIMCFGTISGGGTVVSNGNAGVNGTGPPANATTYGGSDAAGGGGGGGTIILNAVGGVSGVSATANGGVGGNQVLTRGAFFFGSINEAEGPGGGGGGGYIAVSSGAITRTTNGGNNGTTNSDGLTEFPPNGATRGCPGTNNAAITYYDIVTTNYSICAGQSQLMTVSIAGTPPPFYNVNWYTQAVGGSIVGVGTSMNTGVLAAGTYTYYVTTCPGWWREPVVVTVNNTPAAPTLSSNSPICSGNTLNLFSNTVAGATYTWTGPNSFSSALEDPTIASATTAATGTYSLTITAGACTSPMSTVNVTVNPTPAAPTVGSNSPLCAGQTLNLTANTVAGATYTWTGPNSFSSALEDPTIASVTTAASGTYSLTITVNGCTSVMSTVSVTVSNTPAAPTLSSNTPICSGNTLNLFSNTVAGGTYTWTGPNSFSSALEDPTIASASTAASGTYSLTITVGGCTSPMSTTAVVVNPTPAAPTVGSNSPICAGQTLNLTANTVAGATYTWTGPNSFSSSLEDPTIPAATTAATGTYSLTITVGGCTSAQSTVSVIVGTTPSAPTLSSNTPVCSGNLLTLFSNTVAGGTYTWTGPNSFSSALEDPTIAGVTTAASGTYSLTISIGSCTSPQSTTNVVVNPTPAAPTVGSNSPLCSGQTLNLTANTVAGATYTWTGPNSFSSALEDPTIGSVTTAASGTYSLTITVGGCTSAMSTVNVTVNNTPAAPTLSSNTPVCSGNALNLFSNTVAGGTYTWSGPNSFSSGLEDPIIAGATTAASGTYSLTISVGGCTSPQSTTSVIVNPTPAAPTVGSNSPICAGQNLNLTANTVAGATYTWTGPNSFSSSLEDPTITSATTAATGTYSLTITVGGCTSAQSTVSVVVGTTPAAPTLSSNTPVCSGNLLTLFSNTVAGGTYTWTGPNSFSSSLEDPTIAGVTTAASGTYSLTISIGACTSPQSTTNVVVNQTPAAPTVGSNSPVCSGQTLNLTSNTVAGATYTWTGPNSFTSSLEDPSISSVTTAATGTYSLTVTVAGCASAQSTVAVIVNQTPSATATSNSPVCSGTPLNLFSNTVAGATYTWTGPNSFSSSLEDPVIASSTVADAGTYSLTITANGCSSALSTVAVVVNQTPPSAGAASNSPLCSGQTLNLTATTVVSATYAWTGPNSYSSALEDPSIVGATVTESGMYYVVITANGCTGPLDSVAVVVNPIPVPTINANPAVICDGDTVQLSAGGGTTYTWNGGTLSAASGANQTVTPSTNTTYTVVVADANGCVDSTTAMITVNPLPVADAGLDQTVCAGTTISINGTGGGTYTWNGGTLVNANGANQSDTPPSTTDYELTVTTINGCVDLDTVTITVNALPIVTAGPDVQICLNSSTTLNGGGATNYVWTPAASLSDDSIASPIASPLVTTTYVVVGTDINGCSNTDTVVVTIGNNLTVFASNDITICPGDTANLTVTGGTIWTWSPSATLDAPNSNSTNAFPSATTTYTVDVLDANGCVGQDSVTVFINPAVNLTVSGAATICIGQTASLSATATGGSGSYTYIWSDTTLTGPGPNIVSPTTTTTYSVNVLDSIGCSSGIQTVTVNVNPPLVLGAITPASACAGGTANITASGSGGDGNYTYTWMPGNLTGANQTVSVLTTTTYTVILTDGCGTPADTQMVVVTANQPPVVSLSSDLVSGCAPLCVNFTGTSTGTCVSEAWTFGDSNSSTQTNPSHCYTSAGTYDVSYTCTDVNGCVGTVTSTNMITAFPSPTASVSVPTTTVQLNGGQATVCVTDASTGAVTWNYVLTQPSGTQTSSQQNPCFTVSDTGNYQLALVVTNSGGCQDTTTLSFDVEYPCTELWIPSAFSPNGDQMNDTFFVYGSCIAFMQLEIYSRWGEQVFISTTPSNGWDGKWRGKDCESAVFTYVLRGQMDDGTPIEMQGNVTLTR